MNEKSPPVIAALRACVGDNNILIDETDLAVPLANALKQHPIGLEETDDGVWSIFFGTVLPCSRLAKRHCAEYFHLREVIAGGLA